MALDFTGATTDRVSLGSAAGIDDPSSFTVAAWAKLSSITSLRVLCSKANTDGGGEGWRVRLNGTGGNLQLLWNRVTTTQNYITNSTPVSATGTWYFIAVTTSGTGGGIHIYRGTLTAAATEATYGTTTGGAGAIISAATRNLLISNLDNATPDVAWPGQIAYFGYWHNTVLSLAELVAWQWRPRMVAGLSAFHVCGYAGTGTQPDYSGNGNNGTVTGATVADHVPIPFRRGVPLWGPKVVTPYPLVFAAPFIAQSPIPVAYH